MFNKVIVAVVGSSNSGKTSAIEVIIKGLINKGYTVASVKHISDSEFTIDTKGKDTWKHAKAGASTVLSVAPNELATIKKLETTKVALEQLIAEIPDETDVIVTEGLKALVARDLTIPKIVAIKTDREMSEAFKRYKNILAFVGHVPNQNMGTSIPVIDPIKEPERLVEVVTKQVEVQVERKRKREGKITIYVNGKMLPLGEFVQNIIRNSVIAMVSSLKGVKIKGEEKVSIVIKELKRGQQT